MNRLAAVAGSSDRTFARAFAARERWAFEEAYARYGGLLYSIAYNVLGSAEDAEDCVHDTLVRIWKNPHAYSEDRGMVNAFLAVCVRNEALTKLRSARRKVSAIERFKRDLPDREGPIQIEDYVETRRLREALVSLPDEQRTPLTLAYFEGKTHVQIAAELHTPLGTIKSRIAQGLRRLGSALAQDDRR